MGPVKPKPSNLGYQDLEISTFIGLIGVAG